MGDGCCKNHKLTKHKSQINKSRINELTNNNDNPSLDINIHNHFLLYGIYGVVYA